MILKSMWVEIKAQTEKVSFFAVQGTENWVQAAGVKQDTITLI